MRGLIYFLGILSGCFIGPTLDRWHEELQPTKSKLLVCAPADKTQRAILTFDGQCHIQPINPWKRTQS